MESLFKQFEKAGDRAVKTKRQLADQMTKELTTHAYIEETLFYPAARKAAPDTAGHVLESIEEHHVVVWMLSELAGMDPASPSPGSAARGRLRRRSPSCKPRGDWLYPAFVLLLAYGLRRGEVLGLSWRDVDLEHGVVRIRQNCREPGADFSLVRKKPTLAVVTCRCSAWPVVHYSSMPS